MKLSKNQFVLYYNPSKYQNYELCLVEKESSEEDDTVEVIKFSRINHGLKFEPFNQEIIEKDKIFMVDARFTMKSYMCPMTNEEKCLVEYSYSENNLKKKVKAAVAKIEEQIKEKEKKAKKIVGKKSHLEISMKLKESKEGKPVVMKKKRVKKEKPPKFKRGKNNPLITEIVERSVQMESVSSRFNCDCCVKCNNKELIRAISTNNRSLFDTILKSSKTISSIRGSQGCGLLDDTFSLSLQAESPYYFERLMRLEYGVKDNNKVHKFITEEEVSR
jgi:hypothetical protein